MPVDTYPAPVQSTPSSQLGYAEVTAVQAGLVGMVDLAGLAVTVYVPAGRRIKITGYVSQFNRTAGTATWTSLYIFEGATQLAYQTEKTVNDWTGATVTRVLTPTPGTHTYKLAFNGDGTQQLQASTDGPAFILVEDITGGTGGPGPIQLAYAEQINVQTPITTTVDLAGLAVTVNVPAGRRIKITGHCVFYSSVANDGARLSIMEGATLLNLAQDSVPGSTQAISLDPIVIITPTAGTHTYKLTMARQWGTGNITMDCGAVYPAFILVEDITGTPSPAGILPTSQTLAYAPQTSELTAYSAKTDVPGLSATVVVPDGRRIRVSARVSLNSPTIANAEWALWIIEDGVNKQVSARRNPNVGDFMDIVGEYVTSPGAGIHTYKAAVERTAGTGTANTGGTQADRPAYILVEDITGGAPALPATSVPVGVLTQSAYGLVLNGFSTVADVPGSTVNITVPAGRTIKVTAGGRFSAVTTSGHIVGRILQDGVEVARFNNSDVVGGQSLQAINSILLSPSAGAHTYKLTAEKFNGGNTCNLDMCFIMVEDVTPTPAPASTAPSSTLGYTEVTTSQTIGAVSTETDITGASVTVTVPAGRRLKISAQTLLNTNVANDEARMHIKEGATYLQTVIHSFSGALWETFRSDVIVSPSAGTHTYFLRANRQSGTGSLATYAAAALPTFILVEDITGSGISGHTHTELDDTGWITPAFVNGWLNYDAANYNPAGYRKIGKVVYLRGLVKSGTTAADIFILPPGFRPLKNAHYATPSNAAFGILEICVAAGTPGGVKCNVGSNVWFSIECSFTAET